MNLMQKGALLAVFLTAGCGTHKPMVAEHSAETQASQQMPMDTDEVRNWESKEFAAFGSSQKDVLDEIVGQTGFYRIFDVSRSQTAIVLVETRDRVHRHGIFTNGSSSTYIFLEPYESVDNKQEWKQKFKTLDKRSGSFFIEKIGNNVPGLSENNQGWKKVLIPSEGKECQILLSWDRYAGNSWDTEMGFDYHERKMLKGTCKVVDVKGQPSVVLKL